MKQSWPRKDKAHLLPSEYAWEECKYGARRAEHGDDGFTASGSSRLTCVEFAWEVGHGVHSRQVQKNVRQTDDAALLTNISTVLVLGFGRLSKTYTRD